MTERKVRVDRVFIGDTIDASGIEWTVMSTESTATGFTKLVLHGDVTGPKTAVLNLSMASNILMLATPKKVK